MQKKVGDTDRCAGVDIGVRKGTTLVGWLVAIPEVVGILTVESPTLLDANKDDDGNNRPSRAPSVPFSDTARS